MNKLTDGCEKKKLAKIKLVDPGAMALYTELIKDQKPELKSSRKGTPHIGDVVRSMIFFRFNGGWGGGRD